MLTRRRRLEMQHGKDALLHRIGEGDGLSLDQLPNPFGFSSSNEPLHTAPDSVRCGCALAESFLKLSRPGSEASLRDPDKDSSLLAEYVESMPSRDMRFGFLCHIENLLQVALLRPEHLPAVAARLDALDNEQLQEQAAQAFCWEPVGERPDGTLLFFGDDGGIFAGLLGGEE